MNIYSCICVDELFFKLLSFFCVSNACRLTSNVVYGNKQNRLKTFPMVLLQFQHQKFVDFPQLHLLYFFNVKFPLRHNISCDRCTSLIMTTTLTRHVYSRAPVSFGSSVMMSWDFLLHFITNTVALLILCTRSLLYNKLSPPSASS